jgi:hypothetical protein
LDHREKDSRGSFVAWGTGFTYEYNSEKKALNIVHAIQNKPLIYIDLDRHLAKNPLLYARMLEKVTQVNALVFSNNHDINLADIFENNRLIPILENSAIVARHSYDLETEKFENFSYRFCETYILKSLQLTKYANRTPGSVFYAAEMKTENNNSVHARASQLNQLLDKLSEKTVRDLMTTEYNHHFYKSAQNLLVVSSNLSVMGRVLDKNFIPLHKTERFKHLNSSITSQ